MNRFAKVLTRATGKICVPNDVKRRAVADWKAGSRTAAQITQALGIQKSTLTKWAQKVEAKVELRDSAGRPPIFEQEDVKIIQKILTENWQKSDNKFSSQYKPDIIKIRNERDRARGHGGLYEDVSRRTIYNMEQNGWFKVGGATQPKTDARAREEASLRNFVSLATAVEAVSTKIDPHLHFNMDATQISVDDAASGGNMWHSKPIEDMSKLSTRGHGKTPFGIKYFCLGSAAGMIANPVLVVACPSMKAEEMAPFKVPGLSGSNQSGSFGWLVCMQTRQPNAKFMDWITEKVIIPFVEEQRDNFELYFDGDKSKPMPALMHLDGEEIQMQIFDSERLRGMLLAANIQVIKGSASTTAKTQALDVGFTFALLKKAVKYSGLVYTDGSAFEKILRRILTELGMDGGMRTKAVHALQKATLALKEIMNIKVIKKGFKMVGLHPYNRALILKRCTVPPTATDMDAIEAGMETLVREFRDIGHNLESTFDMLNIRPDTIFDRRSNPKDKRAIQSERCVYMSHDATFDRRLTWLAEHPRDGKGTKAKRGRKSTKVKAGPKAKKMRVEERDEMEEDSSVIEEVEEEETATIFDEEGEEEVEGEEDYVDYDHDEPVKDLYEGRGREKRAAQPNKWFFF